MDPLFTLSAGPGHSAPPSGAGGAAVAAVCFLRRPSRDGDGDGAGGDGGSPFDGRGADSDLDSNSDSDSDSDSDSGQDAPRFRCEGVLLGSWTATSAAAAATSEAAALSLRGDLLASCHAGGKALLWDLGTRRAVSAFGHHGTCAAAEIIGTGTGGGEEEDIRAWPSAGWEGAASSTRAAGRRAPCRSTPSGPTGPSRPSSGTRPGRGPSAPRLPAGPWPEQAGAGRRRRIIRPRLTTSSPSPPRTSAPPQWST